MGRPWWQRAGRALANPVAAVGDAIGGTAGKVISNVADPGRMIGGTAGNIVSGVSNPGGLLGDAANSDFAKRQVDELIYRSTDPLGHLSGGDQVDAALKNQMAFADKGISQLGQSYGEAQGLLSPYQQGGAQNFQDMQGMVRGGAFSPAYQQYAGPMSGNTQNPQFQGYGGPMSTGNVNPMYQGYGGPMSSGIQAPQYQQYGGPSEFQAGPRPERMAGTTENVNMYRDPGYQFRLDQGLNAIQGSAAARGLLQSSGTLKGINDYAQNAASQEFGNAYGRMMDTQANRQADFESDRGFGAQNFGQNFARSYGMNQDANAYGMNAANFNQGAFEGDRAFGWNASQAPNAFNQQNADRTYAGLVGDRAAGMQYAGMQNDFNQQNATRGLASNQFDMNFGYGMNQDMNTWNANQAQNNYGMWNNMVGMGYNAANAGANMATGYGQNLADLYAGQGNAYAAAAIAKANARSGLIGQGAGLLGGLMGGG